MLRALAWVASNSGGARSSSARRGRVMAFNFRRNSNGITLNFSSDGVGWRVRTNAERPGAAGTTARVGGLGSGLWRDLSGRTRHAADDSGSTENWPQRQLQIIAAVLRHVSRPDARRGTQNQWAGYGLDDGKIAVSGVSISRRFATLAETECEAMRNRGNGASFVEQDKATTVRYGIFNVFSNELAAFSPRGRS